MHAQQTTSPIPCYVQKHHASKASPRERIKKRKKLAESRTTSRNSSKALERCEKYFAWDFWREKM